MRKIVFLIQICVGMEIKFYYYEVLGVHAYGITQENNLCLFI